VLLEFNPDAQAGEVETLTVEGNGEVYVLVARQEKTPIKAKPAEKAEADKDESDKRSNLFSRERRRRRNPEFKIKYVYTLESISPQYVCPWPKLRSQEQDGLTIHDLYACVPWSSAPPRGYYWFRGSLSTPGSDEQIEIVDMLHPRKELIRKFETASHGISDPSTWCKEDGKLFIFKLDIPEGVVGRVQLKGELLAFAEPVQRRTLKDASPDARQAVSISFPIPAPTYTASPSQIRILPTGIATGSVLVRQCETGKRVAKITIGDAVGYGIMNGTSGTGSVSYRMLLPYHAYEKPPNALLISFESYGQAGEAVAIINKVNKGSDRDVTPERVKQYQDDLKRKRGNGSAIRKEMAGTYAKLGWASRDPTQRAAAFDNSLKCEKLNVYGDEFLELTLRGLKYGSDETAKRRATLDEARKYSDARYAKVLLKSARDVLLVGQLKQAHVWTTEARKLAEPLYDHDKLGPDMILAMSEAEKDYARALFEFTGDLEGAQRLWKRYQALHHKRYGNDSKPDRFPFSLE
jgi:hypothetical protein